MKMTYRRKEDKSTLTGESSPREKICGLEEKLGDELLLMLLQKRGTDYRSWGAETGHATRNRKQDVRAGKEQKPGTQTTGTKSKMNGGGNESGTLKGNASRFHEARKSGDISRLRLLQFARISGGDGEGDWHSIEPHGAVKANRNLRPGKAPGQKVPEPKNGESCWEENIQQAANLLGGGPEERGAIPEGQVLSARSSKSQRKGQTRSKKRRKVMQGMLGWAWSSEAKNCNNYPAFPRKNDVKEAKTLRT